MFDKLRRLTKQLPEFHNEIDYLDRAMDDLLHRIGSSKIEIPAPNVRPLDMRRAEGASIQQHNYDKVPEAHLKLLMKARGKKSSPGR